MNDAPPWQMVRKVAARRLAPGEACTWTLAASALLSLARSCGKLLELQFRLIEKPLTALGARAEHLALHLGNRQCRCSIIASAPESLARVSISAALSASMLSGSWSDLIAMRQLNHR